MLKLYFHHIIKLLQAARTTKQGSSTFPLLLLSTACHPLPCASCRGFSWWTRRKQPILLFTWRPAMAQWSSQEQTVCPLDLDTAMQIDLLQAPRSFRTALKIHIHSEIPEKKLNTFKYWILQECWDGPSASITVCNVLTKNQWPLQGGEQWKSNIFFFYNSLSLVFPKISKCSNGWNARAGL